jgi:hypothetical protein
LGVNADVVAVDVVVRDNDDDVAFFLGAIDKEDVESKQEDGFTAVIVVGER